MDLLKAYLDPIGIFEKEGLIKLLKEFTLRMKYSTPKLENVVNKKPFSEMQNKGKNVKSPLMILKHDYLFLGSLDNPDSNLLFCHSALKILNILVLKKKLY